MARIRCPECNRALSVADEDERTVVRCPACKAKIVLGSRDEAQRPTARPRSEEPPPRRESGVGPAKTDWFVMLAVIIPVLVLWIVLGFFSILVAGSLFLIGLGVLTIGLKRMSYAIKKKKLRDFFTEAPAIVRASGIGGWLALYTHIYHARQMPRTLGLWLFMEGLGTLLLSISVVVCSILEPPLYPGWRPQVHNQGNNTPQANVPAAPPQPEAPRVTGDPKVDRALLELTDKDGQIRGWAAERLGVTPPNEAYRAVVARKLAEAALGPEEVGRGAAARALAEWAGPETVPELIRMLRQAGPLREAAAKGLRKVGAPAEKDVLALVQDTQADSGLRSEAIEILRDIGTSASLPTLQGFVDQREAFLDTRARTAIFAIKQRNKQKR